jgi:cell division septum initiation protein DivIVA
MRVRIHPVEIQHVKLRRRLLGYDWSAVDELLEEVTSSFEEVWLERDALREQVAKLQAECDQNRERDRVVGDVLLSAQRISERRVEEAKRTAEAMFRDAREQAEQIVSDARREPDRLRGEIGRLETIEQALRERYRAFLSGAHRLLDEDADLANEAPSQVAPFPE